MEKEKKDDILRWKNGKPMKLEGMGIFILFALKEGGAFITPLASFKFQELLHKEMGMSMEDISVCLQSLEKKEFIKTLSSPKQSGIFALQLMWTGIMEIERFEKQLEEEERAEIEAINKRITYNFFYPLLGTTVLLAVINVYTFWDNISKKKDSERQIQEIQAELKKLKPSVVDSSQTAH